jgi:predicted aldo/keto reductase-like oxidoreductase
MTVLMSNVVASSHVSALSSEDLRLMEQHANETAPEYCAGCANICEPTVPHNVPISDIMKYLMYARSYGNRDLAKALYNRLPMNTRNRVAVSDYSTAEKKCPQKMAIGRLMKEAVEEFS